MDNDKQQLADVMQTVLVVQDAKIAGEKEMVEPTRLELVTPTMPLWPEMLIYGHFIIPLVFR
ncbi:hypothetical protein NXS98_07710 [Fontisphaera persica]|uniref:hypothetical protein n=1 Tax=Fontisphaera persica TaxID=2974023 RepID=UPI0024BF3F79|nr:hypothetical protein [Fontisphaera persica]WCJ60995.1 hypothetical protein NXS98_07710 [Fontisphaera persica]